MAVSRKRWISVLVILSLLLACMATREPPEIQRSRDIRLGMTKPEVDGVMGAKVTHRFQRLNGESGLLFGEPSTMRLRIIRLLNWFGIATNIGDRFDHYPVRIYLDAGDCVVRI